MSRIITQALTMSVQCVSKITHVHRRHISNNIHILERVGMKRHFRVSGASAIAWCLAAASTPALAQTTGGEQETVGADEIVVTANRQEERLLDIPSNIQAISGATLSRLGASELADFARTIPGLSFIDNGKRGGIDIVLRGLRTSHFPGAGADPRTTSLYIDDIEIPSSMDPSTFDIDRVEVLRGPQGTLYGSGAIGGTLRYITVAPDSSRWSGRAFGEISATRHGGVGYQAGGMVNAPIVEDLIALRVNVSRTRNSGFIDNVQTGAENINWDSAFAGRAAILFTPTDNLRVSLTHYLNHAKFGDSSQVDEDSGDPYGVALALPGRATRKSDLTGLVIDYDLDVLTITSSTSRDLQRGYSGLDATTNTRDIIFGSFLDAADLPEFNVFSEGRYRSTRWSQELRLVTDKNAPLSGIFGLYWTRTRYRSASQELVPIPFAGQQRFEEDIVGYPITDDKEYYFSNDATYEQKAAFGQVKYNATSKWSLSAGARIFDYKARADFVTIDQYFGIDARNPDGTARTTPFPDETASGKARNKGSVFFANTSYQLSDDTLVYATVSEGFRPGGYNEVSPNSGIDPIYRQYEPDSIVNYEVGAKGMIVDNLFFSTSAYYIDWRDIQTTTYTPLGFTYISNGGKAAARGLEFQLDARNIARSGLRIGVGYSYTNTTLRETVGGLGKRHDNVPFVPKHSASLDTGYDMDFSNDVQGSLGALVTYTSNSYTDFGAMKPDFDGTLRPNENFSKLPSHFLVGLSAQLSGKSWNIRLGVDNLFDVRATLRRNFQPTQSPYRDPFHTRTINRPRTVTLGTTLKF